MPYIITNAVPWGENLGARNKYAITSRRAVATLDEARADLLTELGDRNAIAGPEDDLCGAVLDLSEASGGTVGPLPDGTVIEVKRVDAGELEMTLDPSAVPFDATPRWIIDAFNAESVR